VVPARLWRVAGDFVTYIQAFGAAGGAGFPAANELRARLLLLLDPVSRGGSASDVDEARFALVTWADEVILKTDWPGHTEWLREPLQKQLLHTTTGGDQFYDRLALLRPEQLAAREMYFLALALGFEGKLQGVPQERRRLLEEQYATLRSAGRLLETTRESCLSPAAYQLDVELPREAGSSFLRGLLLLAVGLAVVYGILWVTLTVIGGEVPVPRGV
jgi:type IV/VI secretion system ImpK/VasF family protein